MSSTESIVHATPESHRRREGPYFDDLAIGQRVTSPGLTLTTGLAATHQAILGDRVPLALDAHLAGRVTGARGQIANPALVWDVAIGQSTHFSQRAKANLFYRGLALHRLPEIGDTLYTETEVIALRENKRRADRHPTGMMALRIKTVDQENRVVLDFSRCAMIPMSAAHITTNHQDDLSAITSGLDRQVLRDLTAAWRLSLLPATTPVSVRDQWTMNYGDVVTSAPELARLTLNLASVHHDYRAAGSQRLVYGGHTIGLASAQLSKTLPGLAAIVGWQSCDHLAPVYENDTVFSTIEVEDVEPLGDVGRLVDLRSVVHKVQPDGNAAVDVLDWRVVGVMT